MRSHSVYYQEACDALTQLESNFVNISLADRYRLLYTIIRRALLASLLKAGYEENLLEKATAHYVLAKLKQTSPHALLDDLVGFVETFERGIITVAYMDDHLKEKPSQLLTKQVRKVLQSLHEIYLSDLPAPTTPASPGNAMKLF